MTDRVPWHERVADWVLGVVSPTRLMIRKHWRAVESDGEYRKAYELALRMRGYERAYKSAGHSKNHTPWDHASPRSADGELLGDLYTLRNRSRAANRDDAIASGITRTLVRNVIGTGLRPQARTGDEKKDRALEAVWASRKDQLSPGEGDMLHGAVQGMRYGKRIEDGEIFLRPAVSSPGAPIWIENIEADRVRTPRDADPVDPEGRIVDGVEKDRFGRVLAYWILKKHPGDTVLWDTRLGSKATPFASYFSKKYFDRVPAESVCHDRSRVTRPGQTRGVPTCHAVMQDLRDLDLLILASLKRTQLAACLAVFLTSTGNTEDLLQLTAEDYGYQLSQKVEPGMIFRLFPGEKAEFLNPAAGVPDLDKFVFLLARRIGSAIGLSPQAILRAWEGLSYSTARTVKIDDKTTTRTERFDFSGHSLTWEWRVVHEDELLRGNQVLLDVGVETSDLDLVDWIGDEEQWVDPQAEAAATQIMLELQLTSPQIECARLGRDWRAVLHDCLLAEQEEIKQRKELGLPPRATSAAAIKVGDADKNADDAEIDETDADASKDDAKSQKALARLRSGRSRQSSGPTFFLNVEAARAPDVHAHLNVAVPPAPRPIVKSQLFVERQVPAAVTVQPAPVNPTPIHVTPEIKVQLPERKFAFERKNGELLGATAKDAQ
jgi:lambda family phage portal protein